jgi:hypothetical protein
VILIICNIKIIVVIDRNKNLGAQQKELQKVEGPI